LGSDSKIDFVVYPRGSGPGDGEVAHRVRVVGERESVPIACLSGPVVAVVDEESDVTYFRTRRPALDGATDVSLPRGVQGELLSGRAIAFDPPDRLYRAAFFGQPLGGRSGTEVELLQLSLVEAAYLAAAGVVDFEGDAGSDPDLDSDSAPSLPVPDLSVGGARGEYRSVVARGRAVEGDRFDRRLRTYAALRDQGLVSKTGFKFGADFRTYAEVESVEQLGHSEHLVRAFPADHRIAPRDLALDVRLAHGVRKEMVFALVGEDVEWRTAGRLTP